MANPTVDITRYSVVRKELDDSIIIGIICNDLDEEDSLYYAFRYFAHSNEEADEIQKELESNVKRYAIRHSVLLNKRDK